MDQTVLAGLGVGRPHLPKRLASACRSLLCVVLVSGVAFPFPGLAAMVGSVHDFVDDGFTGGGVCAECHVPHGAQDDRLYPRDTTSSGYGAPKRLCMDCHDGTLPTDAGWSGVTGVTPPPYPHDASAKYDSCGDCHSHTRSFMIPNDDCLVCHTTAANGGLFDDATEANWQIDRFFNGIGAVNDPAILSQHQVLYTADGNLDTTEDAVVDAGTGVNECKKCHGNGPKHPSDAAFLVYPDDLPSAGAVAGDPVPRSNDFSTYQGFCLSCHDGVDEGAANAAFQQFSGSVPAGQVGPSDRDDPSTRQTAAPWVVPAVPPKDVNAGSPYTNSPPFFDYYETNGHGLATSLEGNPMNVTCLAGGAGQGCHNPHGTKNRFLVDDLFGAAVDTAGEFAMQVCFGCHVEADLGDPDNTILANNYFHGSWTASTAPLHANAGTGMCRWREYTTGFMDIADPFSDPNGAGVFPDAYAETGILPFYGGTDGAIEARTYSPTLGASWVMCLSCHDPHGTSSVYWNYKGEPVDPPTATENTQAMLRKFPTTWSYDDPLCGECHSH